MIDDKLVQASDGENASVNHSINNNCTYHKCENITMRTLYEINNTFNRMVSVGASPTNNKQKPLNDKTWNLRSDEKNPLDKGHVYNVSKANNQLKELREIMNPVETERELQSVFLSFQYGNGTNDNVQSTETNGKYHLFPNNDTKQPLSNDPSTRRLHNDQWNHTNNVRSGILQPSPIDNFNPIMRSSQVESTIYSSSKSPLQSSLIRIDKYHKFIHNITYYIKTNNTNHVPLSLKWPCWRSRFQQQEGGISAEENNQTKVRALPNRIYTQSSIQNNNRTRNMNRTRSDSLKIYNSQTRKCIFNPKQKLKYKMSMPKSTKKENLIVKNKNILTLLPRLFRSISNKSIAIKTVKQQKVKDSPVQGNTKYEQTINKPFMLQHSEENDNERTKKNHFFMHPIRKEEEDTSPTPSKEIICSQIEDLKKEICAEQFLQILQEGLDLMKENGNYEDEKKTSDDIMVEIPQNATNDVV